jgi:diaminopimelate epimerase
MALPFVKMHGIGNDYVYVDAITHPEREELDLPELSKRVSDRHRGVGSDGLILLCTPKDSANHVRMRMFNADGSESEMCGNGIRCVAKFAHDRLGMTSAPLRVETGRGVLAIDVVVTGGRVSAATVDMGAPELQADRIPIEVPRPTPDGRVIDYPLKSCVSLPGLASGGGWIKESGLDERMTGVSMGNPHIVLFCKDTSAIPLFEVGAYLEHHAIFPRRVNVHFAEIHSRGEATMRTWERGSGATLACGTGACAVAVAGALTDRLARECLLHLPGGDLTIRWEENSDHVFMTGPAEDSFEGVWAE